MKKPAVWKNIVKYASCAAFTALLALAYLLPRDFTAQVISEKYRYLCDAFSIPGLLMILFGALLWVANEGAFLGISYCLRMAVFALIPGKRKDAYEKYGDYVERKSQKKVHGFGFLFLSGAIVMAVAAVFLILYHITAV